jgi:hypothetical protein
MAIFVVGDVRPNPKIIPPGNVNGSISGRCCNSTRFSVHVWPGFGHFFGAALTVSGNNCSTYTASVQALRSCRKIRSLGTLQQSLVAYCRYQKQIELMLAEFSDGAGPDAPALPQPKDTHKPRRNGLRFDPRAFLYCIFGVDLTAILGINATVAYAVE